MSRYYKIAGCIHIHFPIKFFEKGIKLVAENANRAGLDFAILTSHVPEKENKYKEILNFNSYYGKTLIISGQETNDIRKKNHLIIVGEKEWYRKKENIQEIIYKVKNKNAFTIVAHPFGEHRLSLKKKNYEWENWENEFDCVEVWSLLFDWATFTNPFNLPLRYFTFPDNLKGPDKKAVLMWDGISNKRKIPAIAGLDIHLLPPILRFFDIKKNFLYETTFKILRNHLFLKENLSGNSLDDVKRIFECLKRGNLYFSNDYLKNSDGFYFGEENGDFLMGDEGQFGKKIIIETPFKGEIKLIKNGKVIVRKNDKFLEYFVEEKGNYRVEVYFNNKPWIFSNFLYFGSFC